MANNIKIVGNILNTSTVERYSEEDINLISSKRKQELFGGKNDYIEYFIYDAGGNLLNINYNYLDYKLPSSSFLNPAVSISPNTTGQIQTTDVGITSTLTTSTGSLYPIIEINPIQDLQDLGYSSGEFNIRYNFFETKISNYINQELFVKEISKDRTEIRLGSVTLSDEQIESGSLALIDKINNTEEYYVDYILNFGDNQQYVAVNVALNKDPDGYEILFKLYEPLPLEIQEKQTLWVVEEKVSPYTFDINLDTLITPPPPPTLKGPNFDIEIEGQGTVSTGYNNYSNLISSLQSLQNSSYNQIQSLITSQSIDINVDYSNFNNFVFFGSAYQRVVNFYNKVQTIENLQNEITNLSPTATTTAGLQTALNQYSASINNIIAEFDGFEYYLYYNSSSLTSPINYSITPYPKSGSLLPYTLYSTTSNSASVWYNYAKNNALEYDLNNYDNLEFAIPNFIKDNEKNQPFLLFLNMVGHYFDNIWIYLKSVTDINLANNNLDYGISRDLVYQQLKSLGIKLYNSQAGENVDNYLIGANTGSAVWDNDFSITGSYLNNIPRKDLVAELYKRIYHNLPLLVKTKGTVAGLNNLMTTFGIPNKTYYTVGSESFYTPTGSASTSSILNVKEFGGSLKSNLINGYNNDKVRILPNDIVGGNVLSPIMSLQEYPTSPSAFRDDDLHYVDISFSPQTQIDTYISGAIASNNPTWSLDDYIGDPSQLYSGSYPDLDAQRTLYYETGVPGFNPFTSSLLDYNGFIRLIEFFDNSLFKMLNDFVPERTSLSTGVTINSPVLERNKAAYSKPSVNVEKIHEGNYSDVGGTFLPQHGTFYDALASSNDTKAWYDGDISGSVVDVNQYFEDNYNPYLQPSSSIDVNFFNHSDWNVLLNNVSKSVESQFREEIEYFYGTTGSVTYPAELQDSYLSLRSYNTSRYEGSKLTSLLINTYTSASYTGSDGFTIQNGDSSFGLASVIDRNSLKVGWVKNFQSSSLNFFDKTSITLKYLVDENQNLLELNQRNANLFEVQNTFKSGDRVVVSLSDLIKPSFQKNLDGTKTIFKGGFSYDPILYRENSENLRFKLLDQVGTTTTLLYKAESLGIVEYKINSYEHSAITYTRNRPNQPQLDYVTYYGYSIVDVPASFITESTSDTIPINQWQSRLGIRAAEFYNSSSWNEFKLSRIQNIIPQVEQMINTTLSPLPTQRGDNQYTESISIYAFKDMYKFNKISSSNFDVDPQDLTTSDPEVIFKAPDDGFYTVSLQVPYGFATSRYYVQGGGVNVSVSASNYNGSFNFKIFGILEYYDPSSGLGINNDAAWEIKAIAKSIPLDIRFIDPSAWYNAKLKTNSDYNSFWVENNSFNYNVADVAGALQLVDLLNPLNTEPLIELKKNSLLRFRLCLMDYNGWFDMRGSLTDSYYIDIFAGNFNTRRINYGGWNRNPLYTNSKWWNDPSITSNLPTAYFQIENRFATQITTEAFTEIGGRMFELDIVNTNAITTNNLTPILEQSSSFAPNTPTTKFYTEVFDNTTIQQGDLIRFGPFKSLDSLYFNVTDVRITNPFPNDTLSNQNGMVLFNTDYAKLNMTVSDTIMPASSRRTTITVLATPQNIAFFNALWNNTTGPNARRFKILNASKYGGGATGVFLSNLTGSAFWEIKAQPKQQKLLYFPNYTFEIPTNFTLILFPSATAFDNYQELNVLRIPISDPNVSVIDTGIFWPGFPNVANYTNTSLSPPYNNVTFTSWDGKAKWQDAINDPNYEPFREQGGLTKMTFQSLEPLGDLSYYQISLDNNIPTGLNINEDFAILRPKPDETSVIINHRKQDGNVSQTILIPIDANQNIKSKVGDIFSALNTSLSNTNDFTQLL